MPTTKWTCNVDPSGKATLMVQVNEDSGPPGTPYPIKLEGVCYSPAPLNGSNNYAPAIGDWYWDDFANVHGWVPLWQRDFPAIFRLGGNAVRVYCMLSRQLLPNGQFPLPWNSGHLFTHNRFLDFCFNKSAPRLDRHSKYALVGIPIPATMLWKQQYDKTTPAERDYWMHVLSETAQSMANHPASWASPSRTSRTAPTSAITTPPGRPSGGVRSRRWPPR
jgi:hypothetical protein